MSQVNANAVEQGAFAVNAFDAKKSKAASDSILLVRRVRKTKTSTDNKVAKCVSVPRISRSAIEANITALMPAIEKMVHGAREDIFADICDSQSYVYAKEVSLEEAIKVLNAGRLNGEQVSEWFASEIADSLSDALFAKFGWKIEDATEEQLTKIATIVSNHEKLFAGLVSGRTQYTEVQRKGLLKVLEFASEDDTLASRFIERLNKMAAKEIEIADFL